VTPAKPVLAFTGSATAVLLGIGVTSLLLGTVLFAVARRRRSAGQIAA
jgi:LPXTG-motif cell wall-anchored protein